MAPTPTTTRFNCLASSALLSLYAEDAEWNGYRHISPPRDPNRMIGKRALADFQ